VLQADSSNARVVNSPALNLASLHQFAQLAPMSRCLTEDHQARRFTPALDLLDGIRDG
jgi:hypothetical protein